MAALLIFSGKLVRRIADGPIQESVNARRHGYALRILKCKSNPFIVVIKSEQVRLEIRVRLAHVTGRQIVVTLSPTTTASNLITAITGNAAANVLISVKLVSGIGTTNISTMANGSLVQLGGADPAVAPGFRGLESNNREVTYRFATPLDNDKYRFEVIGTGTAPLTNVGGEAVDNGQDTFMNVTLNLGATVTAVVPQPLLRQQFITVSSVANLVDGDTITIDPNTQENSFAIASSAFGSSGVSAVTVDFTAVQVGTGGDGIQLIVTKQSLGTNTQTNQPQVTVNGKQISVVLNSTPGSETTAQQLVNKVNGTAAAKALVTALLSGAASSPVGLTAAALTTLTTKVHLFTFEFNSTGGVRSGNNPITFTSAMTTTQVATAIRDAINTATLATPDVTATSNLEVVTVVGGAFDVRVKSNLLNTSALTTRAGGNMSKAARLAGIDRTTLYRLMEKHGLRREVLASAPE